jgi:two-component system, NarL family, sensor kinase
MTEPRSPQVRRLRILAVAGTTVVALACLSLVARGRPVGVFYDLWVFHNAPVAIIGWWLGSAIIRRRPGHLAGIFFVWAGIGATLHVATITIADARLAAAGVTGGGTGPRFVPADLPLDATIPVWISSWVWLPVAISAGTLLLLVFPDGALPGRRWRAVVPMTGAAMALLLAAYMVHTWPWGTRVVQFGGQPEEDSLAAGLMVAGAVVLVPAVAASIAVVLMRWRRADRELQRQMRPVMISATVFAVAHVVLFPWQWLWVPVSVLTIWSFLASYGIAIARYRIHDLEVVVSRAAVAAVLAFLFTAAYLALVVGVGQLIGRGGESLAVPLLAAGMLAVAFEPVRRRVRRAVDRLLYGREADPQQLLSDLAARLRAASSTDEVLSEVAELVSDGCGAERVEIAIAFHGDDRVVASHGTTTRSAPIVAVPVVHGDERLGSIRVYARGLADLTPEAVELTEDLAPTLGVVLRNARLTAELTAQVAELRRSRERLVHAQDEARRELERDIHDGAQAHLIALRIRLGLAAKTASADRTAELGPMLSELGAEVDRAVDALRAVSRGLHPPVLEGAGIAAALRSRVHHLPVEVRVLEGSTTRHIPAVESAVYFSCLEAIQNATKHGEATCVTVELTENDGTLHFAVIDDGAGFDPDLVVRGSELTNLEDRIASLGGTIRIDAGPGRGTRVVGEVPAQPVVSAR